MSEFDSKNLKRVSKGKADPRLVKPIRKGFGMQSHGFKGALKALKKDPVEYLEESFKKQVDFVEERVKANVPKASGKFEDSIEVKVKREKDKVSMIVSSKIKGAIRAHEDPETPSESIPEKSTEEGGRGPKFIKRVFEKHSKKLQAENVEAFAKGIGEEVKKSKSKEGKS